MSAPLRTRLAEIGRTLAKREQEHREPLDAAWARAKELRQQVAEGLEGFHQAIEEEGAPQLAVVLGEISTDDKHVRSVEFELRRGRHRGLVIVKSRGHVTLVGPFHAGKNEGPCKSTPWEQQEELQDALGNFVANFLEEAATP